MGTGAREQPRGNAALAFPGFLVDTFPIGLVTAQFLVLPEIIKARAAFSGKERAREAFSSDGSVGVPPFPTQGGAGKQAAFWFILRSLLLSGWQSFRNGLW